MVRVSNIVIKRCGGRTVLQDQVQARAMVQGGEAGKSIHVQGVLKMKSLKVISLVLIATSLASGAVYAKGGGGSGMGGGMGNGSFSSADPAQRTETRSQDRVQERTQKRDGSQAGDAQRNEYRYENRYENRAQMRNGGDLPSMQ